MSGKGRFKSRSEKTKAGREAIAGDIDGSNNILIGFPEGNVLVKYSRKGFRAGFSWLLASLFGVREGGIDIMSNRSWEIVVDEFHGLEYRHG